MKTSHILAAGALLALSHGAFAQTLKPGLWEITNKMQGGSGGQMDTAMSDMQKQLAAMPPEQRKMMEEMMAKQGVKMGTAGPGGVSVQVCMTREMVEKNQIPSQQGDCKSQQSRSGNVMKVAFTCTNPPSSGEGQVTFVSSDAYTAKMTVNTQVNGKPEKVNMDGAGKFLSADCGNIKPMTAPTK